MKAYKGGKAPGQKGTSDPNRLRLIEEGEQQAKPVKANESEAKYSAALVALVNPFRQPVPEPGELEHLLELASIAWNIATLKKEFGNLGDQMLKDARQDFKNDKESLKILEKLVKEKTKHYAGMDMMIREFRIIPDREGAQIVVTAIPLTTFLLEGIDDNNEDEDEEDDANFAPGYINRNGFSLVPQEPFLDWLHGLETPALFPIEINETPVFLIGEMENNEKVERWLKKNFDKVFRTQLAAWCTDEKYWPGQRSFAMFSRWFKVNHHSMIFDFESFPVDKDGV